MNADSSLPLRNWKDQKKITVLKCLARRKNWKNLNNVKEENKEYYHKDKKKKMMLKSEK